MPISISENIHLILFFHSSTFKHLLIPLKFPDTKCYKFNFYDVEISSAGGPSRDDLRDFIFTLRSAEETHSFLFHCHHGRSRSTAAFLIALAQSNPGIPDDIIMKHFRDVLP